MQGARAPALASTRTSGNPGLQDGRATHGSAVEAPGNGGNDLAPTPSVSFLFLGGLREPDAPVAGERGLLVCAGRAGPGASRTATAHASGHQGGSDTRLRSEAPGNGGNDLAPTPS